MVIQEVRKWLTASDKDKIAEKLGLKATTIRRSLNPLDTYENHLITALATKLAKKRKAEFEAIEID